MPPFTSPIVHSIWLVALATAHLLHSATFTEAAVASTVATTANPFFWYVTRAAAMSAYIVLTVVVLVGISRSLIRMSGSRASWVLDEVHQFLALLVAALVGLHLVSLFLDPLIPFSLLNFALPIAEPYRPFAVDLGVLALYGLIIVLLSSWLRRYIAYASWRLLHYTSFAVFLLVTLHGVLAGSDSGEPWMVLVYLGAAVSVILMTLVRMLWLPEDTHYPTRSLPPRRQ
jgi:methionine sulfoxide reductase heme-binding subunit